MDFRYLLPDVVIIALSLLNLGITGLVGLITAKAGYWGFFIIFLQAIAGFVAVELTPSPNWIAYGLPSLIGTVVSVLVWAIFASRRK